MTWFINMRTHEIAGSIASPAVYEDAGVATPGALLPVQESRVRAAVAGKAVLLATHGFNVNRRRGAANLGALEAALRAGLPASPTTTPIGPEVVYFGVLWPGDYWIPAVNYPFEGSTATTCGRILAEFCATALVGARSFSFISHSLGARLVLEAANNLHQAAETLCLTAAAVNADVLAGRYSSASRRSRRLYNLASHKDLVLRLAFPAGDILGDLLNEADGSRAFRALGYAGAQPRDWPATLTDRRIPDDQGYGHGDYLPEGRSAPANGPWRKVAGFMMEAYSGMPASWPP